MCLVNRSDLVPWDIRARILGPLPADHPQMLNLLRTSYLHSPSLLPYNLSTDPAYIKTGSREALHFIPKTVVKLFKEQLGGFFVEAGAFDGERTSNTLWLEKHQNWTGLLVEPNPYSFQKLVHKQRKAWASNTCLSPHPYPIQQVLVSISLNDKFILKVLQSVSTLRYSSYLHGYALDAEVCVVSRSDLVPWDIIARVLGPLPADHPQVLAVLRASYLQPPSLLPYNLSTDPIYIKLVHLGTWSFIYNHTAKFFREQRGGFFVEAGGFDGEKGSNTLWLEKHQNWTGLLVEPNPYSFQKLVHKQRKAWASNTCLSPHPYPIQQVLVSVSLNDKFNFNGLQSGLTNRGSSYLHGYALGEEVQRQTMKRSDILYVSTQCFPLASYLLALNVTTVDFLSLDIQGVEKDVLENFPWTRINVRVVVIEVAVFTCGQYSSRGIFFSLLLTSIIIMNMRTTWSVVLLVVLAAAAATNAMPQSESDPQQSGSKTFTALKEWFSPVTSYFSSLPAKTPSDVADDVKDTVTDAKDWVQENEAIQGLYASLQPARNWIKEKTNNLRDQSFTEMYENVKQQVRNLDTMVGTWIQDQNE
ncbi:hypothetical protein Pmani_017600 [Petrolisthes manimaculis]|uniref:Methyltransferase FkbM domain-containing protein n=1 Tax=Petrolisthes manimaculis TaxID=1843537 RepID=A0AAE1PPR9_9EUCA|nr:hypothetical protein Pmani_017600 [Petrolisthes manimaculis]